ncbi:MAG: hypothetical protein Q8R38_08690 [Candidatus Omnitrophota bacterium]|nr:hypothetical protein [Candidatus Omnitrophota bacterium]
MAIRAFTVLGILFLLLASVCGAEGLDVLIQVSKSQADIKKQYDDETKNFEKVKKAINAGTIKKGQARSDIQARYGMPVVSIKDLDGKREDCIYKPGTSSFFKGVRATLIYTEQGTLDEARIEEK